MYQNHISLAFEELALAEATCEGGFHVEVVQRRRLLNERGEGGGDRAWGRV